MTEYIDWFFWLCVDAIVWLETMTGISYEAWNLILFVFLQPLLILLFFCLWIHARFVR
jgi:hypothetical protein